ncbi:MAG: FkbM family methyltransferase [Thermodesulfobacteriota bacterium]|nr:FkbM family methyltransferase [Thermodesulfobacteriota bacterium]
MGDKDDAGNQLAHCAILSGTGGQTKVHCVGGDGATWICDQVDRVFGPQATFLINFYHLCDYFSAASKTCAPDNPSAWIKEQKDRMKENNAFDVVNALKPHVEPDTVQDKDAPVRKCHRYIKNRHGQFDLKEGIFIDIGAHVGKYAIRLANRLGDKGEVIAIEPEENNFKILEKNAKHNKLENIHLLNVACFNKDGEIPLYVSGNYTTLHSIYRNEGQKKVVAKALKLDTIVSQLNIKKVDLIKIDVEGAEIDVIKGSREILRKYHPRIIFEAWDEKHLKEMECFLKKFIYQIRKIDKENYLAY